MATPVLEAHNLRKCFGDTTAVDGVDLVVEAGQAYGLVGPDGAGKTTTLRLLVGALHSQGAHSRGAHSLGAKRSRSGRGGRGAQAQNDPCASDDLPGQVRILGQDLRQHGDAALGQVGYLAQRFSLYGELTVAENLRFFAAARSIPRAEREQRSAELLGFVGLSGFERRRADQLSGGMKQKLGLACALIHRPRLLLLDEPTTGVDPVTRQDFWQLIIRLLGDGVGVVVSTPYMDEAARCHRLGFMYGGRILREGTPHDLELLLTGRVIEVAAQPKEVARRVCQADPDVENVVVFGDRLHLRLRNAGCAEAGDNACQRLPLALAAAGVHVEALRLTPPSLEDVFLSLLEHETRSRTQEAVQRLAAGAPEAAHA